MFERFTDEEAAAAKEWLASIHLPSLQRGMALGRSGKVMDLGWNREEQVLQAVVQGGKVYDLTTSYQNGQFQPSHCSCPFTTNCKHAAAAMLEALRISHGDQSDSPKKLARPKSPEQVTSSLAAPHSLLSLAQAKWDKPIGKNTRDALVTIDLWWKDRKHKVQEPELFRLIGKQNFWGRDWVVLFMKESPPRDALEYLGCVEAAMTEAGEALPEPIPSLIDRARQNELRDAVRGEARIKEWQSRLQDWARSIPEIEKTNLLPELRLRLTTTGAVIEWCKPGQTEFSKPTATGLKNMPLHELEASHSLLLRLAMSQYGYVQTEFNRSAEVLTDVVYQCLELPRFRHLLVSESGGPLVLHEEPLNWKLSEGSAVDYILELQDASGRTPPNPLLIISSTPGWFVTAHEAWRIRKWPFEHREAFNSVRIPAAALTSAPGVKLLRHLDLPLPGRIQQKVKTISGKVTVQAKISDPEGRSSYLQVLARADYDDHAPSALLTISGWRANGRAPSKKKGDDSIVIFNKTALNQTETWLGALGLAPSSYQRSPMDAWFQRRITKEFPDQFLQWISEKPPGITVELDDELTSLRDGAVSGTVKLHVEEAGMDWFDLRVALDVADLTLTSAEINLLLKAQGRWIRIKGKGWRKLHFALTPEQEQELAAMGLAVTDFDGEPQRLHALQLAAESRGAKSLLPADRAEAVQRRANEIQTRIQPELPAGITAALRPYQLEGFHFLAYLSKNNFGGVLADDMGLGKTLQALTWVAWLRAGRRDGTTPLPVLVVCPKSVQDNWLSEAARFCPALRVTVWTRDDAGDSGLHGEADLLVIHYQQLRQYEETLSRQSWLAVILDEAQAIKNPISHTARSACSLRAEHRLALSGTPIENRLLDLWSIMAFAMPGVLGNRAYFSRNFDAKADPFARRRLAARVRPFLLRRTKKEVAQDLPDRVEEDLICELEGIQETLYQAELKRARASLLNIKTSKQLDKARFHILTSLLRLRQICCHPALVLKDASPPEQTSAKTRTKSSRKSSSNSTPTSAGSAKLDALMELLEPIMEEGNKVLVFSQFVEMLDLIRVELETRQWTHYLLTGQTDDRGALVEQFQTCDGPAVFLISLKAGGSGLNLTAASYVVLCDPWWNPAVEAQAIDRTHRIGQTQKVNAYRLIVKNSIEEKIRQLQKHKNALAHDILGEENFTAALTLDDFQFLLGGETL